jgi:hypothetical protein
MQPHTTSHRTMAATQGEGFPSAGYMLKTTCAAQMLCRWQRSARECAWLLRRVDNFWCSRGRRVDADCIDLQRETEETARQPKIKQIVYNPWHRNSHLETRVNPMMMASTANQPTLHHLPAQVIQLNVNVDTAQAKGRHLSLQTHSR